MSLKKYQFLILSVAIHAGLILLVVGVALPKKQATNKTKPVKSYLFVKSPTIEPEVADMPEPVVEQNIQEEAAPVIQGLVEEQANVEAVKQETTQEAIQEVIQESIKPETQTIEKQPELVQNLESPELESSALESPQVESTTSKVTRNASSMRANTAKFIQDLNSQKLDELSFNEALEHRKPKPLIDRTKEKSKHAQRKALSTDFAPPGTDIMVLAEFGPNEKTVVIGDNCMTVTETDLNDKVYRGKSVYKFGGQACGGYDKFNGQLQKSLDKFLKKK